MLEKKQFIFTADEVSARAATSIVSMANKYKSDIFLIYQGEIINLKNSINSIIDIMSLGIKPGTNIKIIAIGNDEELAIQSIIDYVSKEFYQR